MRIVFFGTPDFAVASLDRIRKSHEVAAVVTAPDKPSGRGQKVNESAVKKFAGQHNLVCLQPGNLKSDDFQARLKDLDADIFVVVAFRMMPEAVWSMPRYGTVNLHASYLPNYRGAAPINWVLINGENYTGVSTFFLRHEIDTGAIIEREKVPIDQNETAGELHDRLMDLGAGLLLHTLDRIESGEVDPIPQDSLAKGSEELKPAPRIYKEDRKINWDLTADIIHNRIRGLSPYPGAFSWLEQPGEAPVMVKLFRSHRLTADVDGPPGHISVEEDREKIRVACGTGSIEILELQWPGKKRMTTADFLRGHEIKDGTKFIDSNP